MRGACGNLPHATSSNSLRVSADLFEQALRQGEVVSRSAAPQIEHWAGPGAALEASQLTVPELVALLRHSPVEAGEAAAGKPLASAAEAALWAHRRAQRRRDITSIEAGRSTNEAMSWFSGGRARRAKARNSPF